MHDPDVHSLVLHGREALHENRNEFVARRASVERLTRQKKFNEAAVEAEIAACFAEGEHCGLYFSPELESALRTIGTEGIEPRQRTRVRPESPARVLHVITDVAHLGGIPKLFRRWVTMDVGREHSLCLTSQHRWSVPQDIVDAVGESGGTIYLIGGARGGLVARARQLRQLSADYDLAVTHGWECDPVPTIAFADSSSSPPVIQVNHGDGKFWVGASVASVVMNLRRSGARLTVDRRGVDADRSVVLPTPIEPVRRTVNRTEAKRRCGLDVEKVTLLSVARAPKYRPFNGVGFAESLVPFLRRHPETELVVVGPGGNWDFSGAEKMVPGQLRVLGETDDTTMLYQAADVYVDSFPFVSITSLLEAGSYGTPLITRHPFPSDQNGVYGADMPGLDGRLITTRSMIEFESELSTLVLDEARRVSLGGSTRDQIPRLHWGDEWQRTLESVYSLAMSIPPRSHGDVQQNDEFRFGEPDVIAPVVYGRGFDSSWIERFVSGSMNLDQRIQHWKIWRRDEGHTLGLTFLLPDWMKYDLRRAERFGLAQISRLRRADTSEV